MTAFDQAWDIVKFEIPLVGDRTNPDFFNPFPMQERPFALPGVGFPDKHSFHPFVGGQTFGNRSFENPRAFGDTSRMSNHATVYLKPIFERVLGIPDDMEADELTDEQIDRIIDMVSDTATHEAGHQALNAIFPYEGFDTGANYDEATMGHLSFDERVKRMHELDREYARAHEFGAHTIEASQKDKERILAAAQGMMMHPAFSDDPDDPFAMMQNPHGDRATKLFNMTDQERREYTGRRALENARRRME